jgi:hypothetical protein
VLDRALYETLLWSMSATRSRARAEAFQKETEAELLTLVRANLRAGTAQMRDRQTGDDRTAEFLDSEEMRASATRKRMTVADLAKSVGLGRVHTMTYGIKSLPAHGRDGGLFGDLAKAESTVDMLLESCNGLLESILRVCEAWASQRRPLEASTVIDILYPPDLWPRRTIPTA